MHTQQLVPPGNTFCWRNRLKDAFGCFCSYVPFLRTEFPDSFPSFWPWCLWFLLALAMAFSCLGVLLPEMPQAMRKF